MKNGEKELNEIFPYYFELKKMLSLHDFIWSFQQVSFNSSFSMLSKPLLSVLAMHFITYLIHSVIFQGWLISNSSLLCPSDKHPYVEAVNTLRFLGSSGTMVHSGSDKQRSSVGDSGPGDFICHADRDVARLLINSYFFPTSTGNWKNSDIMVEDWMSYHRSL